jgi:anti-sigma regulatory factor (Ser/Thr protein kinase)
MRAVGDRTVRPVEGPRFRHEALFYAGEQEFMARTLRFIRDAVSAQEPILVAVSASRAGTLRAELGAEAGRVGFLDMTTVGRNPARIIPAWRDFVHAHAGSERPLRGIGEPIWHGRTPAEVVECHRHEFLLNLAFSDAADFWLVCPYDVGSLEPEVVDEARRSHPFIANGADSHASVTYVGPAGAPGPFEGKLSPPAVRPREMAFGRHQIWAVRDFVARHAAQERLEGDRLSDLILAVSELATNSVTHAGGHGKVRVWREGDAVLCEVSDDGRLQHPLAGRERPAPEQTKGRGLWLVNHMCDLVQMRSRPGGNVVRVHMAVG